MFAAQSKLLYAVDYIFNLLCAFICLQPMKKFVFSIASRATGRLQIKPSGSGDENGRQCGEQEHAQYCTNHDVTSGWSSRRPENVSILSSLVWPRESETRGKGVGTRLLTTVLCTQVRQANYEEVQSESERRHGIFSKREYDFRILLLNQWLRYYKSEAAFINIFMF